MDFHQKRKITVGDSTVKVVFLEQLDFLCFENKTNNDLSFAKSCGTHQYHLGFWVNPTFRLLVILSSLTYKATRGCEFLKSFQQYTSIHRQAGYEPPWYASILLHIQPRADVNFQFLECSVLLQNDGDVDF